MIAKAGIFRYDAVLRGVAQPGSAHAWGACGRRFKSSRPDQFLRLSFLLMCRCSEYFVFTRPNLKKNPDAINHKG